MLKERKFEKEAKLGAPGARLERQDTPYNLGVRDAGAERACRQVHRLLEALRLYGEPREVPFLDGLYFFYELGEASRHAPNGRIVRVGNHPRSEGGLVRRLRQHFSGQKNGSVFRKFLGGALLRTQDSESSCLRPRPGQGHWEKQDARGCARCQPVEGRVSNLLRERFRFRCVAIADRGERNVFEARLVATLAQCMVCQPSALWLGRKAYSETVRRVGLWNSQFADGMVLGPEDLRRLAAMVESSSPRLAR